MDNLRIAENMASLIDGYCSLVNKSLNSIWINPTRANQTNEKVISSPEIGTPKKIYETKKSRNEKAQREFKIERNILIFIFKLT